MRSGSGQLSDDRSECVEHGGAEDELGEADLLPSALDSSAAAAGRPEGSLASSRRAAQAGRYREANKRDYIADDRDVLRELLVQDAAEVAHPCGQARYG